jgi:enamine deaminase RidA (YjgF/YER057c/UK114 family)
MPINLVNPDALPKVDLYHQVSIATGSKLVFIAGQVARTAAGDKVGEGDLATQVERCYLNLAAALEVAGARFSNVVKLTAYLVDWTPDKFEHFSVGAARAFTWLGIPAASPPFTGIGVAALAEPDMLVEIEAIAVID